MADARPCGTTITAETSPCCMAASSSASDPVWIVRIGIASNCCWICTETGVLSSLTKPTDTFESPLPEKSTPNSSTNMIGKKNVQKRAARSRTRPLRLAIVRRQSVSIGTFLVPQRSTGQVEEHVFEGCLADPQVARLGGEAVGQCEQIADGGRFLRWQNIGRTIRICCANT